MPKEFITDIMHKEFSYLLSIILLQCFNYFELRALFCILDKFYFFGIIYLFLLREQI